MNVVFVAIASRIALLALMALASDLLPTHGAGGVHLYRPADYPVPAGPGVGGPLAAFTRWDSAWLLSIAENGYPTARWVRAVILPLWTRRNSTLKHDDSWSYTARRGQVR